MELIEGKDLRTVMAQAVSRDALPEVPIAAYIISEVASGSTMPTARPMATAARSASCTATCRRRT